MAARGLDHWLNKLSKHNMPVAGQVIAELNSLTGNDDTEINQLAEVILRDPHLTSHVLRISNSVHYNHSGFPINTVSRAVVLIGLKGMRAICISLLLIDTLLGRAPKEQLLKLIAQALHAATQARDLIEVHQDDAGEEVFIAALLFHLGEMAFLASETQFNQDLFEGGAHIRREAMESTLGTSFKAITRGLAQHWRLGETLERALYPQPGRDKKVAAVILGERMSRAALKGWGSEAVSKVVAEVSQFAGWDSDISRAFVMGSAERATEVALQYGAPQVCPLIPTVKLPVDSELSDAEGKPSKIMRPNAQLQLSILRELATAASEKIDINTLFQMVVEGMHRGIGLERVVVAFIQNHRVQARYMLGEGTSQWRTEFDFDMGGGADNMFTQAVAAGATTWVDAAYLRGYAHLMGGKIEKVLGRQPALIHVVNIGPRPAALFYADRHDFGGIISRDQFESFRHFGLQIQAGLNLLTQSPKGTAHKPAASPVRAVGKPSV